MASDTRTRILEAALSEFNLLGAPNVSANALAARLGISPGNLYYHFRTKDEIIIALFEVFEREMLTLIDIPAAERDDWDSGYEFLERVGQLQWKYQFIFRDTIELMTANLQLEKRINGLAHQTVQIAKTLIERLKQTAGMQISADEERALTRNMALVFTYWPQFDFVLNSRMGSDIQARNQRLTEQIFDVQAMLLPYLPAQARERFKRFMKTPVERLS